MLIYSSFALVLISLSGFKDIRIESKICTKSVPYAVTVTKSQTYKKPVTVRRWNGRFVQWVDDIRIVTQIEWLVKTVETCCDGYTRYRSKCVPLCDEVCENSKCTAPNICTCNEGYEQFNKFRCIPHCENCKYGSCIAPNFCECFSNYEKDSNGTCQPKCINACVNGYCANPDFCLCYEGYKLSKNAIHICEPICEPVCKNGKCVKPNECQCLDGYEFDNERNCKPICANCENGDCIAPGKCECHEGYKNMNEVCEPICENGCENGVCVKANVCECFDGYAFNNEKKCKPICSNCVNGNCISPGKCECYAGYENIDEYCEPVCEPNCINGNCSSPNKCDCNEGYQLKSDSSFMCEPICEGCENGRCEIPGICECFENFEWDDNALECIPVTITTTTENYPEELNDFNDSKEMSKSCDKDSDCENGECIDNKCVCNDGIILINEDGFDCVSLCEVNCKEGVCNNQNECIFTNSSDCINGFFIEPNMCECFEGYVHDFNETHQNRCIPLCDNEEDGCINGTCVGPNTCECEEGFELSPINQFICIKVEFTHNTTQNNQETSLKRVKASSNLWALYSSIVILSIVIIVTLIMFITKRMFGEKEYNIGKRESRNATMQYSKKDEKAAVLM